MREAIPVWTNSAGDERYVSAWMGATYHRGPGPALALQLWNSLGDAAERRTMTAVALTCRAQNLLAEALLAAEAIQVYTDDWHSLTEPVLLEDLAAGASQRLWVRLALPEEESAELSAGRVLALLAVSWE